MTVRVRIDKDRARQILWEEAAKALAGYIDRTWEASIVSLSDACEGASKTHIAALGTAILAKCTNPAVDVFALKASVGDRGYSARSLAKDVLAPNARELDINIGATGPEPLNNQPYFHESTISRDMNVKGNAAKAVSILCDVLDRLQALPDEASARAALRAYIAVRRRYGPRYSKTIDLTLDVTIDELIARVIAFVSADSEGGRRAQAIVAALMDLISGVDRVKARRINDPSRTVPGDVAVRTDDDDGWERTLEVRDKPVSREDLIILASRAADAGVGEAIMVAVAAGQPQIAIAEPRAWAAQRGVSLTLFTEWDTLIRQVLLWAPTPALEAARHLPNLVQERLIALEVPEATVASWGAMFVASRSGGPGTP
ncbi:MAG: restriction endonuclease, SacI family [Hyphomicrobiaceae bacterium]|nr:MAG: restriction endonuclease, SacI family [Hyphomicrobiaceae bacterium]